MTPQEFLDEFGTLAESAEGVPKLRELILELAVRGKLVEQDEGDEPAADLLDRIKAAKEELAAEFSYRMDPPLPEPEAGEIPMLAPSGWVLTRIGDMAFVKGGKRLPKGTAYATSPTPHAYIRVTNLKNGTIQTEDLKYIAPEVQSGISRYTISKDDLYITIAGTIGDVGSVPTELDGMNLTENAAKLVFRHLQKDYARLCMRSQIIRDQFFERVNQMAQPKLALKRIATSVFPLPPLAEQHRIVSKVDELMGLCDRLEAVQGERCGVRVRLNRSSLDRLTSVSGVGARQRGSELSAAWQRVCDHFEVLYDTPETLPDLRQTILQLAVQGKLVPQDPNDEPAEKAIDRIKIETARLLAERVVKRPKDMPDLDTVGRPFDISPQWQWVQLADVLRYGPRNGYSPKPVDYPTPVMSLTLSATTYGRFDATKTKYIDEEIEPDSHLWLQPGDILIQRSNSPEYVGITAVYDGPANGFIYPDLMMKFRVAPELEIGFVNLVMKCPFARDYFRTNATGTSGSMRKVNQSIVSAFPLPVPPLSEQKRIVSKVTHLLSQVTRLESTLTRRESTRTQLLTAAIHSVLHGVK